MAHTTTKDHADTPCLGSHLGLRAVQIWPHLSPGAAFRRVSHAPHLSNTVELAVMTNEQVTQPESWPSPSPTAALRRVDLHTSTAQNSGTGLGGKGMGWQALGMKARTGELTLLPLLAAALGGQYWRAHLSGMNKEGSAG